MFDSVPLCGQSCASKVKVLAVAPGPWGSMRKSQSMSVATIPPVDGATAAVVDKSIGRL